jgi:heme A synthase
VRAAAYTRPVRDDLSLLRRRKDRGGHQPIPRLRLGILLRSAGTLGAVAVTLRLSPGPIVALQSQLTLHCLTAYCTVGSRRKFFCCGDR